MIPVRLYSETRQRGSRRARAAMGAASRELAHNVLNMRRWRLVQHVLVTGMQLRPDARDASGVGGRRRDGPTIRQA